MREGRLASFAMEVIHRGVPERFPGHASAESTRRCARLADDTILELLRHRGQAADRYRQLPERTQAISTR